MLTETQAWQKIYDAFERYENGVFNRMAATGICNALSKLLGDEQISNETHAKMMRYMRGFLLFRGLAHYPRRRCIALRIHPRTFSPGRHLCIYGGKRHIQ